MKDEKIIRVSQSVTKVKYAEYNVIGGVYKIEEKEIILAGKFGVKKVEKMLLDKEHKGFLISHETAKKYFSMPITKFLANATEETTTISA